MQERPMRFHWFWSHISMFLGMLSGFSFIGQVWDHYRAVASQNLLWAVYLDTGFGVLYSTVCLCAFINRNKRTLTAWHLLLAPPLLSIAYSLLIIALYSGYSLDTTQQWGQVIGFSICWVLIYIYYQKRKPLFNNYISTLPHEVNAPQQSEIPSRENELSADSEELKFEAAEEPEHDSTPIKPKTDQFSDLGNSPVSTHSPKYCDNCGTECETWVKFCPVCGCKTFSVWIKKPIQVTNDPELLKKTDKNVRKYLFKKHLPIITMCVLCTVLVAISVTLYINLNALNVNLNTANNRAQDLSKQLSDVNASLDRYQKDNIKLRIDNSSLQIDVDFLNCKIGFIVDGSDQYHTYDCPYFRNADEFYAHNIEYCEYLGYTAHSCWDK